MMTCNEFWRCNYADGGNPQHNGGYSIVPFGSYYGLYYWNEDTRVRAYLSKRWKCLDMETIEHDLPPEAQFGSVQELKDLVGEMDAAYLIWIGINDS